MAINGPKGAPKGGGGGTKIVVIRPFCPLKPIKTTLKEVLEVLLEVLEVPLEVLDLSWRPLEL